MIIIITGALSNCLPSSEGKNLHYYFHDQAGLLAAALSKNTPVSSHAYRLHSFGLNLDVEFTMVGEDFEGGGSSSSPGDDSDSTAAFSLVKYENPEIIDIDDSAGGDKDGESCEEILNSILPPREWINNGKLWRQSVSASPATRLDVMNLQEQLDHKLQQRQARETGICQVRRELYSQCFDELIRQSTINCVERGEK